MSDTFEFVGKHPGHAPQFFTRGYDEAGPGIVHFELDAPGFDGHVPHPQEGQKTQVASFGWGEDEGLTVYVAPEPFDLG